MNATGCITALNDGGEAFVVLPSDDRRRCRPDPAVTPLPPLPPGRRPVTSRPPTPPPPPVSLPTAEAYKSRPRRKDRGAFVVLREQPTAGEHARPTGGRVSPFRGQGFRTLENGRSRASSPSSEPLRRQSSEPRIVTGRRTPPDGDKRRLSASTKDLSAVGESPKAPAGRTTITGKPPPAAATGTAAESSPRRKVSPRPPVPSKTPLPPRPPKSPLPPKPLKSSHPPGPPKSPLPPRPPKSPLSPKPPKSPLPVRPPKTPRRMQQPTAKAPAFAKTAATKTSVNRPPPSKSSSPRLPKKQSKPNAPPQPSKANAPPPQQSKSHAPSEQQPSRADAPPQQQPSKANAPPSPKNVTRPPNGDNKATVPVTAVTATASAPSTTTADTVAATSATISVNVTPVTASTSATAIATTHAANAVASAVVPDGPIVTAAPPPAAIAANTLATLSVVDPSANGVALKPPQSAMRSREPPVFTPRPKATTVIVVDDTPATETVNIQRSVGVTKTTPPLSYELQEIIVEPETENQSGRTPVRLTVGADVSKTSSTSSSSNGHKTVAWARQPEKIIVPAETPQLVEVGKDPAYKRFARKLCWDGRRRPAASKVTPVAGKMTPSARNGTRSAGKGTPSTATADGRPSDYWAAVWKRRPRLCRQCCGRKERSGGPERPVDAAARPDAATGVRRRQWWRRLMCCRCFGKRKKNLKTTEGATSSDSVGVLGISPPTVPPSGDTFKNRLKRWLCCCCGCCSVPELVRRLCCRCPRFGGSGKSNTPNRKSADKQRSKFKCTGCCTNIPKLDTVFVDHSSVMKGAIPVLPVTLAWLCLVFNVIIPGAGTFSSGMLCLCVGKPRFTVNDNFQSRFGAFCVNIIVAVAQLFTVLFCLVGWGWSIWWGVIMLKMAKKYQKIRVTDQPAEAPVAIDQNHRI